MSSLVQMVALSTEEIQAGMDFLQQLTEPHHMKTFLKLGSGAALTVGAIYKTVTSPDFHPDTPGLPPKIMACVLGVGIGLMLEGVVEDAHTLSQATPEQKAALLHVTLLDKTYDKYFGTQEENISQVYAQGQVPAEIEVRTMMTKELMRSLYGDEKVSLNQLKETLGKGAEIAKAYGAASRRFAPENVDETELQLGNLMTGLSDDMLMGRICKPNPKLYEAVQRRQNQR